jgi:hypothetical protein
MGNKGNNALLNPIPQQNRINKQRLEQPFMESALVAAMQVSKHFKLKAKLQKHVP